MANLPVVNALGSAVYLKTSGAGGAGDPHVPAHTIDDSLPAGTNNIGDVDVVTFVGDNADLDSGVGADNHALVVVGLPGAGGHVIGGTGSNPFMIDTTASTVQPVSVASFNVPINVVASIPDMPNVIGSVNVGNFPAIQPVSVGSWFPGADVVASVVGNPAIIGSVNVGNFPAVQPVGVASWFPGADVVASVIGAPSVLASIPNVPSVSIASAYVPFKVEASIPNVSPMSVASFLPHVRPYTVGSQWSVIARVQASVANAAPVAARGAGAYNYVSALSVVNAAASYGGPINLCDGTATLWTGYAAPAGGGFAVAFPQGLKPAANATLFLGVPVYSLDLYVSISGFQGP